MELHDELSDGSIVNTGAQRSFSAMPGADDLALKILPPKFTPGILVRERLSLAEAALSGQAVISVLASGGFGKTQLLGQWYRQAWRKAEVAAWLTLDGGDDDVRFIQGIAAAMDIGQGRPTFRSAIEDARQQGAGPCALLKSWLAQVAASGCDTMLLLDGVDKLPSSTVTGVLGELLLHAPPNLRVVLSTREPIALPLADLMARGRHAELTEGSLAFTLPESCEVLRSRYGAHVSLDRCARLHELTAGWPLGMQLATADRGGLPSDRLDTVHEADPQWQTLRRFSESLLSGLSADLKTFLMRVSVLDPLVSQACDAIRGDGSAADAELDKLRQLVPLMFCRSGHAERRIQPVLRMYLQAIMNPSERRMAHERAGGWFASRGRHREALHHSLCADRADMATHHVLEACTEMREQGHPERIVEWLGRLPHSAMESCPDILLIGSWAHAQFGRPESATDWLASARARIGGSEAGRFEIVAIESLLALRTDKLGPSEAMANAWAARDLSLEHRAILHCRRALVTLNAGAPARARLIAEEAIDQLLPERWGATRGELLALVGRTYLWEGQLLLAEEHLRSSLSQAEDAIGRRGPLSARLAAMLASALCERHETGEAAQLLADRIEVLMECGDPEEIGLGVTALARCAMAAGQPHRAHQWLDGLRAMGEERGIARFKLLALAEQIRMQAASERSYACASLLRRLNLAAADETRQQGNLSAPLELLVATARSYASLAGGDWRSALSDAGLAGQMARSLGRAGDELQAELLKGLAQQWLGEADESMLNEVLGLVQGHGMLRLLSDLKHHWRGEGTPFGAGDGVVVAPSREALPPAAASALTVHQSVLTPKQLEVLQLVAQGLSNKEIARAVHVGEETVKWHLRNLRERFSVGSRKHVVARARLLGYLEVSS